MTRVTRQPRCSTDPEPTAVDVGFAIAFAAVIFACAVVLWCDITKEMIAECLRRLMYRP